jgi:hypothetical protein
VYNQDSAQSGTPDCPVVHRTVRCARLNSGEQAALGRSRWRTAINHRTVRWCTGQCPVSQRSAGQRSDAQSACDAWPSQRSDGGTGLSGMHRTVSGAPTTPRLQRSSVPVMEGNRAPDSVRCATRLKARFAFLDCFQRLLGPLCL